ncbi:hypothetical protein EYZ11_004470 [Aspergillus tanneri]|uniref:Glucose-methanol-choline oxidoreductase N-terminal domain-containing protein n=1 Tax=Aspergillus tanneri TaxID=1220188 RepID=A0A4S3JKE3_9EURO|nr:uncharacterized protein ATNIH1004_008247 [Aspergillus tanneri]KAA8644050.1 hypothetical protein ATNIH1004_008247 [Aspergillus tanneri]THC96049.1 hypothetical protein EYZ11_004470 [Aspergillus tanneri]
MTLHLSVVAFAVQALCLQLATPGVLAKTGDTVFDYVVVGGGNAGLTVASRLSEDPAVQVAVIEAGDFYEIATGNQSQIPANDALYNGKSSNATNPLVEWGFMTTPQAGVNGQSVHYGRGKALGGCTALNYMAYQRPTVGALERWAETVGDDSWTFDSVLSYYKRSLNFTPPDMHKRIANATPSYDMPTLGTDGPLALTYPNYAQPFSTWLAKGMEEAGIPNIPGFTSGHLNGSGWLVHTIDQTTGFRESSEVAFLTPFIRRPNLALYKKTLAEKILFRNNTATGVRVASANNTFVLSARREVIVSAGTFQSPQLLLVSGVGPADLLKAHDIKVVANRPGVGQNMNDHVFFGLAHKVNVQTSTSLSNPAVYAEAVQQFRNEQDGPLASPGGDYAAFERVPDELRANFSQSTGHDVGSLPSDWPEIQYFSLPAYVGDFWNPGAGGPTDGNYATIMATLVAPMSRGNVSISSSSMHDAPLINPNWLTEKTDVEVAIAAFKRVRQIFGTNVLQKNLTVGSEYYPGNKVSTDDEIYRFIQAAFQTMYHASSTCKMGKHDDEMAVVDSRGHVYGTRHLRVVDASVFPFLPPALPQGTVYMVAEKIADDIKSRR